MGLDLDDPSNMTKKPDVGSNFSPQKTEMTFWSRYDAVRNATGPTDHWTKMKMRATERVGSACPSIANSFERSIHRSFDGLSPGSYHLTRPRTAAGYRNSLRTSYNERAKEDFQYWIIERPKPTPSSFIPPHFTDPTNLHIDSSHHSDAPKVDVTYTYMTPWE